MDRQLRQQYCEDFIKMRSLINEFDPCNFINVGAPEDEYDYLTQKTLSHVYLNKTKDEIKKMIMSNLDFYYGCVDETMFQENKEFELQFKADFETFFDKITNTFEGKKASREQHRGKPLFTKLLSTTKLTNNIK